MGFDEIFCILLIICENMQIGQILTKKIIKKSSPEIAEQNLAGMVLRWSPFKIIYDINDFHIRWLHLLK